MGAEKYQLCLMRIVGWSLASLDLLLHLQTLSWMHFCFYVK